MLVLYLMKLKKKKIYFTTSLQEQMTTGGVSPTTNTHHKAMQAITNSYRKSKREQNTESGPKSKP